MARPSWQTRIIFSLWPFRYVLAAMAGWPVIGALARRAFQGDKASYIPIGITLDLPGSVPAPTQIVTRIIGEASFRFLLHKCVCRDLEGCSHYPVEAGCLFLGEGAREIAPGLGREVSEAEALAHHERAVAAGLIPVVGRLRWDSMWLGVKRADRLVTLCHCCECCCYFKIYRFLPDRVSRDLRKLEGLEVKVGEDCDGCGLCVEKCFIQAMSVKDGRAVIAEECRGCGRCASVCPRKAIQVTFRGSGFEI